MLDLLLCHPLENTVGLRACLCTHALPRHAPQANAETVLENMNHGLWCVANAASAARCLQVLTQAEVEGRPRHQR